MTLRLEPTIDGPDSADTIVFLQGWPDDATIWAPHVAVLSSRYRCVRTTLPNYDGRKTVRRGHTTDEIVDALAAMVREVSPEAPVTLVLHDWGCFWGHILHQEHPELVSRITTLDVAPHIEPGPGAMLMIIAYQWWLIGAFLIAGPIGDWMTRSFAKLGQAPMKAEQINSWMNYPYRNVWADIFSGRAMSRSQDYWPEIPLLFVYGKQKPLLFHSKKWTQHIEENGGTVVGLDCGHWVQTDPGFLPILERWLDASENASATSAEAC